MISLIKMIFFIAVVVLLGIGTIALRWRNLRRLSNLIEESVNLSDLEEENRNSEAVGMKQDLNEVVVPKDTEFSEVMELLVYLAKKYPKEISLKLNAPASASAIRFFEQRTGIRLTEELNALYQFANGFELNWGNFELMELEQVEMHYKEDEYEWGNTKKFILLGSVIGDGEAIFLDGETGHIISNDHGKEKDFETITNILDYIIDIFAEVEDERLESYLA